MNLSGQQRKELQDALVDAFPAKSSLEQMLSFELDKNLDEIAGGGNLQDIVFNLIIKAEAQEWIEELIHAAREANPRNPLLRAIAEGLLPRETPPIPLGKPSSYVSLSESTQQQQKILILAANPKNTSRLRLDEELREIEQGLQRAKQREQFEIKSALAARARDIHRSILYFRPNIVHFSGHGAGQDGLIFEDETGQAKLVDALALARLFKLFADRVKCVILNACYSEIQAKAIAQHIDYVIGMSQAVGDRAAIEFAVGFYDALGAGESIEFAHELGCIASQIQGITEELTPKLLDKKQIVDSSSANEQNFNPQTNVVIETRSAVVTAHSDDDLNTECPVSQSDRFNSNQKDDIAVICSDSKEDAIAEYRLKVEKFLADDGKISFIESEILKDLQEKLKLTEEEARAVRDEVLEPLGIYQENLDKYRQVFTKLVDEQGYSLSQEDKAELKKLQEHYQLKDEDIALLFKEAEQQQAEKLQQQQEAERLRQEHRIAEYLAKLHRYEQELSKAVNDRNVDYTRLRDFLKAGQWKKADEETLAVMLKASGRDKVGWLNTESIENFPCTDLATIDKLWVEYSNGRFGFSVQKRIWLSVGKDVGKFGDAIGWRKGGGTLGLMGWMNWI
ncbi:MAG: GUN4 domain-containing protein, partial [Scytonema sp. PMC 1069.18]|nr:GUN4 domain-containing protein [Scytonema sp. PMC 1069.18]